MAEGTFTADEMLAIREQYEERIAQAEQRREELEWSLRMELARLGTGEMSPQRATDEMRRVEQTLRALLEPKEIAEADVAPAAPPAPAPSQAPVVAARPRATPPPHPRAQPKLV